MTADKAALLDLRDRLKAATGPDRKLDDDLHTALCWVGDPQFSPAYTGSLDDAVGLYKRKPDRIPNNALDVCREALEQWVTDHA